MKMGIVQPQEIIEDLSENLEFPPKYTPRQIGIALNETGELDQELFSQLIEAYTDYTIRLRKKPLFFGGAEHKPMPEDQARNGALNNLACICVAADLGREPATKDENPARMFEDIHSYGPTMKAFSSYIGLEGIALSMKVFPTSYIEKSSLN